MTPRGAEGGDGSGGGEGGVLRRRRLAADRRKNLPRRLRHRTRNAALMILSAAATAAAAGARRTSPLLPLATRRVGTAAEEASARGERSTEAVTFPSTTGARTRRTGGAGGGGAAAFGFGWSRSAAAAAAAFPHGTTHPPQWSRPCSSVAAASAADVDDDKNFDTDDDAVVAHVVPRNFVPVPFQYREEMTLRVESLTNLGLGICRATHLHDNSDPHPDESDPLFATDPFHGLISSSDGEEEKETTGEGGTGTGEGGGGSNGKRSRRRRRRGRRNTDETLPPEVEHAISHGGGWVVMIPNVIPGELIECRVFRNRARYSEADLIRVIEASPERVEPQCELFDKCGGCQYQHMSIKEQRDWKNRQVEGLFERVGKFAIGDDCPEVLPTLGTDEIYHYRSKITPHYDRPSVDPLTTLASIDAIGFKEKTSRRIVDVPYCHIATESINTKLAEYRENKFAEAREGRLRKPKKGATLLLRDAHDVDTGEAKVSTDNNEYVMSEVAGVEFKFQAGNFFQNNPYVLPLMVERVTSAATRGGDMTHLIDCYCGSGLFCLSSSSQFDVCVGIEVNEKAVKEASANAERNGIKNCKFVAASAEAIFASKDPVEVTHSTTGETRAELVRDFPRESTVVVVDPPRKGCSMEFLKQLEDYAPQRVVYMSCDPATQARDARIIAEAGYNMVSVEPFDLFPQTRHIECMAVFERRS